MAIAIIPGRRSGTITAVSSMSAGVSVFTGGAEETAKQTPQIKVCRKKAGALLPRYASSGAAGADLAACIESDIIVEPGSRAKIPTGLSLEIPAGWEGQVRPRSGLAWKEGLTVINAPGTIDSDYRGELEIALINLGSGNCTVRNGDRIAQIVFAPAPQAAFIETAEIASTLRGGGGFGSTGKT